MESTTLPEPRPQAGQLLVKVGACGVCRTDLHVVDGELSDPRLPLIPGHEIDAFNVGDRVGIPWLGYTCGTCAYCLKGRENLCDSARFTGYTIDGGYADYTVADSRYCFRLPSDRSDPELAPWLCAGLIGYRALRMAGDGKRLGIYGFGAAAHIVAQIAHYQGREIFAFTRPGDAVGQRFAREMGAAWAGGSDDASPAALDAALLFAPVGSLVPKALRDVAKGGTVICAGIHMSDIPQFPYALLWGERHVLSVANLTRRDGIEFMEIAQKAAIRTSVTPFPLSAANDALRALRGGALTGAAVLTTT